MTETTTEVIGEAVAWDLHDLKPTFEALRSALSEADLDPSAAREMLPRNAFLRICKHFKEGRDISVVDDNPREMVFQFTKKFLDEHSERLKFAFETKLTLDKNERRVHGDLKAAALVDLANERLDVEFRTRRTADVTAIIKRLMDRAGMGRYSMRRSGGYYFVPAAHLAFIDKIDAFLRKLGASLARWSVAGTTQTYDSAEEAISSDIERTLELHMKAIEDLSDKSRESTWRQAAEQLEVTRFKIESTAKLLRSKHDYMLKKYRQAKRALARKLGDSSAESEEKEDAPAAGAA